MKLLLDTHTALWLFNQHERLSPEVKALLLDENNALYLSIVSVWEIAIKTSLGKLTDFSGGTKAFISALKRSQISLTPITLKEIEKIEKLPFIHRDPFDRLIIATALCNEMLLLSGDNNIHQYAIKWYW